MREMSRKRVQGSGFGVRDSLRGLFVAMVGVVLLFAGPGVVWAQRTVTFPPAESKPPPPVKSPPRTQAAGEDTGLLPDFGPTMRKTQERQPPPPTSLTVMYKVEYGEVLRYVYPDGTAQKFQQWLSYQNDGFQLMKAVNERLQDGNNYLYATKPLASPGFDPVDIPLLYMTGDYDFQLKEAEVGNLRRFLLDGGTILFNAARGRDEFSLAVVREMKRVFPQKNMMKLPPDHPIFNSRYRISQVNVMINGVQFLQPPELYAVDIGTRSAAILAPSGFGSAWSGEPYHPGGQHVIGESAVRLGVNLVAYVLASTEYGRYLAQEFPVYEGSSRPGDVFRFALARYAGSWDVNPAVQNSIQQALKENTGIDVDYAPHAVNLDDPELANFPLVFMTGHYDFTLTSAEIENIRAYLNKGGMLVGLSAAGFKPFTTAFRRELLRVLPETEFIPIPPSHALFSGGWNAIDQVAYTPRALRDDPTLTTPQFDGLFVQQRLAVLVTPYDVLSGANREPNAYSKGLVADDALRVTLNLITYALSH